ncbi:MAG: prolyl oligopeptidase family serine peptidase, partial [Acidimicrobiia bacterium]
MARPITPGDLWRMHRVGQPVPLPDGSAAVVPVSTHDIEANTATTHLHLVADDGATKPLTRGPHTAQFPALSHDGGRLAFARKTEDDGSPQVHVLDLGGGEASPVSDFPLGAGPALWLPDGSGLVVAVPLLRGFPDTEATRQEAARREEDPVRAVVTEDRVYRYWKRWLADGRVHHLFHIYLESGSATDLTPDWDRLLATEPEPEGGFDISPDGSTVAVSCDVAPAPHDRFQFAVHLVSLTGGEIRRATPDALPAQQRRPRFSPDGTTLLYGVQHEQDFYADPIRLTSLDVASGEETALTPTWDRSAGGWEFADDGRIVLHAEDEGRLRMFTLGPQASDPAPVVGEGSWHGPRPAGGVVWCRHESSSRPPEVGVVAGGTPRLVGSFNDALLADLDLGKTADMTVTDSDGAPLHVGIVYPPGFSPDRPWPLVHNVHGGPHGLVSDTWHWRWNTQVFAAAGRVVASVNFHGSTSWGDDFTRSIRGAWGDKPTRDVLAATDHLAGLGFVDEDKMAIAGGSYGGYLVTWL